MQKNQLITHAADFERADKLLCQWSEMFSPCSVSKSVPPWFTHRTLHVFYIDHQSPIIIEFVVDQWLSKHIISARGKSNHIVKLQPHSNWTHDLMVDGPDHSLGHPIADQLWKNTSF